MGARLRAISGPLEGHEFPFLDKETTVGRGAENDIVLKDPTTSKAHFAFRREAGRLLFRYLDTRNGIRVDGEYCLSGEFHEGSRVECGITIFVVLP
jgi:S-DNA-T family DNA segregation ATPase FtsK/SpoIIIE